MCLHLSNHLGSWGNAVFHVTAVTGVIAMVRESRKKESGDISQCISHSSRRHVSAPEMEKLLERGRVRDRQGKFATDNMDAFLNPASLEIYRRGFSVYELKFFVSRITFLCCAPPETFPIPAAHAVEGKRERRKRGGRYVSLLRSQSDIYVLTSASSSAVSKAVPSERCPS